MCYKLRTDFVLSNHKIYGKTQFVKPHIICGTLEEDLARRDFTINCMAKSESGELIDLFGGQDDLAIKVLRTPIDPTNTLLDVPLRIFRALRFCVTKDFEIDPSLINAFKDMDVYEKLCRDVSVERIREELNKMFSYNTTKSLELLVKFSQEVKDVYPKFLSDLFEESGLWLKPTIEKHK